MERYLKDFEVDHKNPSEDALMRWRKAVSIVKNPRRRFRFTADLAKRDEAERLKRAIQEKIRVALYVKKAASAFLSDAAAATTPQREYKVSDEVKKAGFKINPDDLASVVREHDVDGLRINGGVKGIARELSVSLDGGVRTDEISIRQSIYGCNKYTEKPPPTFLTFVWEALHDLTLIILMVCAAVSIGVGISTEGWPKGMYDGLGIILIILLVVMVTAISDYMQSLPFRELVREKKKINTQVTRDGRKQEISIYDLVVGDVVQLSIGNIVPADGIYISGYNLVIDESSLMDRSEPVNINEEKPFLLAGTKVQDGLGSMLVTAVGVRTEWGKLMETLSEGGEDETPLQVKMNGVAMIVGKIGLGFAVLTFLILTVRFLVEKYIRHEFMHWSSSDALTLLDYFATAVSVIVVVVPEGLPLAVTLSLAFAMKSLMNDKALVLHRAACETMGSARCICTNKTGTLTTNHMVVNKIWICGETRNITRTKDGSVELAISEDVQSFLLQAILKNTGCESCKDDNGKDRIWGTPTDKALFEFALQIGSDPNAPAKDLQIIKVEPFSSVRKKMSTLVTLPDGGSRAFCKGASEIVLKMCDKVVDENGTSVPLSETQAKSIADVSNDFASEALRTLCLAFKDLDDSSSRGSIPDSSYTLVAVVGIKDPVRPGVKEAVRTCLDAGIVVRMVTGDNINTAKAIAKECGILTEDGIAIEGPEFRTKTSQEMKEIIPIIQVMARSLPSDKHTLVTNLRNTFREVVAVTGDGTNDAPALHEADIGLAMGIAGTEVAKESTDVIIMDDNFTTIVNVAKWGRAVYINIQKFVQFQLTVNVVALVINFLSACITGSSPLTAVQLLWVNMIMDTLGALALTTEPPHDGLMKRPPVRRRASFITRTMWRNIFGQSIYQLIVLLVLDFHGKKILGLQGPDATATLNTVIFNALVFCQVFNEINSRDIEKINVFRGMFSSRIFIGVVVCTVVFQAIMVEFLGTFASTVPLSWQKWLICIVIGAISMPVAVVLKCIPVDRRHSSSNHHDGVDALPSGPEFASESRSSGRQFHLHTKQQ